MLSQCLVTTQFNSPLLQRPGYQDHGAAEEVKGIAGASCRGGREQGTGGLGAGSTRLEEEGAGFRSSPRAALQNEWN